jgi:hypothetical protein
MVAAAAMSLPRQLPASFNAAFGPSTVATSSLR